MSSVETFILELNVWICEMFAIIIVSLQSQVHSRLSETTPLTTDTQTHVKHIELLASSLFSLLPVLSLSLDLGPSMSALLS